METEEAVCAYAVYEFIEGPTLYEYMQTATAAQMKSVLWQLFQALHMAHKKIDFTHYDLHLGNVIVREGIPVLIDYGSSHILYNRRDYGKEMELGQIFNMGMWQHDAFNVLVTIYSYVNPVVLRDRYRKYHHEDIPSQSWPESGTAAATLLDNLAELEPIIVTLLGFFVEGEEITPEWYQAYIADYPSHSPTEEIAGEITTLMRFWSWRSRCCWLR